MVQSLNVSGILNAFRVFRNPSLIIPHLVVDDIRQIDYKKLKQQGVKVIAFDKDNCLTAPYENRIAVDFEPAWKLCKDTFGHDRVIIVSNSAGTEDDTNHHQISVERTLGVPVLRHAIKKPGGGAALLERFQGVAKPKEMVMVGDRLFTDVLFGNLNGTVTVLTRKIISEKGDNAIAARIRRFEHRLLDALLRRKVEPPKLNDN
ncbi:mitochondrial PGP phosphatase-domain-containing protein [Umbelopsis sp. PMI_123]|nr:mitochondrial PGP phosphatase-domain-containing protein [Umbelopsis sp. PMI_123]